MADIQIAPPGHHPQSEFGLADRVRADAIGLLQPRLSDALDLQSQLKQAHWNVRGPQFMQLHQLFDGISEIVEGFADTLAERIAALGGMADGRVQTTVAATSLEPYAPNGINGEAHLGAVLAALTDFGRVVRDDIDRAAELGDADTADVFTELSRETDKQRWFVEAHLT
jgi:starvation-inducible DNA-binding protein